MSMFLVQDPSEHIFGPDVDGTELHEFSGTGGGDLDSDSGVLTLTFTPFAGQETGDDPQDYAPTTTRFVEVEKLLEVLSRLDRFSTDDPCSGEWWRAVLAEKLDAHQL
jgi:hypothetical protein